MSPRSVNSKNNDFLIGNCRSKGVANEAGRTAQSQPRLITSLGALAAMIAVRIQAFPSVVQRDAARGEAPLETQVVQPGQVRGLRQGRAILCKEAHCQDQPD